jgi:hypothetical protein
MFQFRAATQYMAKTNNNIEKCLIFKVAFQPWKAPELRPFGHMLLNFENARPALK